MAEHRARGEHDDAGAAVLAAAAVLGSLAHGVVLAIRDEEREIIGLLVVADDRARDAFAAEEVAILASAAAQIGVVVENSRVYAQMKERDRLAVLGQMAAGLAHEIRNPLGAIKGAAQLLADPAPDVALDAASREFLGIILEEVDRLDRVVGLGARPRPPARGRRRPAHRRERGGAAHPANPLRRARQRGAAHRGHPRPRRCRAWSSTPSSSARS